MRYEIGEIGVIYGALQWIQLVQYVHGELQVKMRVYLDEWYELYH